MQTQKKAAELMKSGESCLKTHLFKWNPDYLAATPKFMEASSMFENTADYDNAMKCYEKLALCCEKKDDLAGAADAYQKIGFIILIHKKNPQTAYQYLMKSVNLFKIHGNTLKAQDMLKKLAKRCFDQNQPDLGVQIYKDIIEEMFDDENYGTGAEVITEYMNYLIDKERYPEAIETYMKHIKYLQSAKKYDHLVARAWLGIIGIHIIMGEHYIAEEKLGTFGSQITKISSSDEYSAAISLIDAIQKGDEAAFAKTLKRPIFTQIETSLHRRLNKYRIQRKDEVRKVSNPLFGSAENKLFGIPKAKSTYEEEKAPRPAKVEPAALFPPSEKVTIADEEEKIVAGLKVVEPEAVIKEEKKVEEEPKPENKKPEEPKAEEKYVEEAVPVPEEENRFGGMLT